MSTTTTGTPTAKPADPTDKAEVQTGPEPKVSVPLDPAEIYYNKKWRVPPIIVTTEEQKDALDLTEWTLDPGNAAATPTKDAKDEWPKLYYDVNIPLKVVESPEEAAGLDGRWRPLGLAAPIIKAAQATLDAEAKQQKAKPTDPHKPHTEPAKK